MSYTILSDHSPWGTGKKHIQDNSNESSEVLCGRDLSFNFETEHNEDFNFLNNCTKEDILEMPGVCKICLRSLNSK